MNKVIYVGGAAENGWGNAGRAKFNIIKGFTDAKYVGVSYGEILNGNISNTDNDIQANADNSRKTNLSKPHLIQHILPEFYYYDGRYKNIGVCELESKQIGYSMWPKHMNIMDEIWVANKESLITCYSSGVVVPVKVVPHSIDKPIFKKTVAANEIKIGFNFGFVGEFNNRKNIEALIMAFHLTFHPSEPVNLFFKLNGPTPEKEKNIKFFNDMEESIRARLNIRGNYKRINICFDFLNKNDLLSIMSQLDVFACVSHGESCVLPAMEAMALGVPLIWTSGLGIDDYGVGTKVNSTVVPCEYHPLFPRNIYSGFDDWVEPDIHELCSALRYHYEMSDVKKSELKQKCKDAIEPYYTENMVERIKELFND